MYFTQEDYKKIENWLHRNSVKDTEFQEALPFTGKEIVTVVQDGHNRKVNIQEFINQLYKHGVEDFLNVTNTYRANNITLKEAIRLIPAEARKEGQVITFLNTDGNWEIYQFIGKLNQWNNPTLWNNPFDWEKLVVDSILPDEEDLTKSASDAKGNAYLSLKNRKYEPDKYSGLGRKILRRRVVEIEDPIYGTQEKNLLLQADFAEDNTVYVVRYDFTLNGQDITLPDNSYIEYEGGSISDGNIIDRAGGLNRVVLKKNIINGKNILTQDMVSIPNTIYEIRYDFTLGENITVPDNCILEFDGGTLSNGTIIGTNTVINTSSFYIFKDIIISGTFKNSECYISWFSIPSNEDYGPIIQQCLNCFSEIYLTEHYYIKSEIIITDLSNKIIVGTPDSLIEATTDYTIFYGTGINNFTFNGVNFEGNRKDILDYNWPHTMNAAFIGASYSNENKFYNCRFENLWYGICPGGHHSGKNTIVKNCVFNHNNTDIDMYGAPGVIIEGNIINNCTENSIQMEPYSLNQDILDFNDYLEKPISVCNIITNNVITNCAGWAIIIHPGTYNIIISNNNIYNYGQGIFVQDNVYGVTIDNNIIKNCIGGEEGQRPDANRKAIWASGENQIISNNLILYSVVGIRANGIIRNNVIKYTKHTAIIGVSNSQILNNVIIGTNLTEDEQAWWGHCAIYCYYGHNILIDNNYFEGTENAKSKVHCIYCTSSSDIKLNNNTYKDYTKIVEGTGAIITNNKETIYLSGETSNRPNNLTSSLQDKGKMYFDTTLGKPIYWNGTAWIDATGATV